MEVDPSSLHAFFVTAQMFDRQMNNMRRAMDEQHARHRRELKIVARALAAVMRGPAIACESIDQFAKLLDELKEPDGQAPG